MKDIIVSLVPKQRGVFIKIISRILSKSEFAEIVKIIKDNNGRYNYELKSWGMNFQDFYYCKKELKKVCTVDDTEVQAFLLREKRNM
jgi:hypothetical protein